MGRCALNQTSVGVLIAFVGIAGTLSGIVIGHFLGRSWDRRKWLLDRRNEEFKELMTAVAVAFSECGDPRYRLMSPTVERTMELHKASRDCLVTIQNRIYIAKYIKPLKLDQRWLEAFDHIYEIEGPRKIWGGLPRNDEFYRRSGDKALLTKSSWGEQMKGRCPTFDPPIKNGCPILSRGRRKGGIPQAPTSVSLFPTSRTSVPRETAICRPGGPRAEKASVPPPFPRTKA
jgi:hypothetical protein